MIKKGFTLIELLVVISIIGILVTIVSVSFVMSQKQARDVQRKSDIKQYQNALENFANGSNVLFPSRTASSGVSASTTLCNDLNVFFEPDIVCPEDPKASPTYKYQSDGSGGGSVQATKYVLWAQLESAPTFYWVVCSNGRAGQATTGIPPSPSGVCPI